MKLVEIEQKRSKIRERQKVAERNQRLLRPGVETGKGALVASVLLKALSSPGMSVVVDLVDQVLAGAQSVEIVRVKQLLGVQVITVAELCAWLRIEVTDSAHLASLSVAIDGE